MIEHVIEYFGVLTGLLYLLLEIKQHRAMWVVGFLSSLIYVFVFFNSKIYADMGLNTYYVFISIYGFWKWTRRDKTAPLSANNNQTDKTIVYRHPSIILFVEICAAILCLHAILYYILYKYTDSPIPFGDSFTTAVGIVATWMLARRIIEHWIFWIIVNFVSVYLYYLRGLYPTMFLYFCYAVLAYVGYCNWKKKGINTNDNTL